MHFIFPQVLRVEVSLNRLPEWTCSLPAEDAAWDVLDMKNTSNYTGDLLLK